MRIKNFRTNARRHGYRRTGSGHDSHYAAP